MAVRFVVLVIFGTLTDLVLGPLAIGAAASMDRDLAEFAENSPDSTRLVLVQLKDTPEIAQIRQATRNSALGSAYSQRRLAAEQTDYIKQARRTLASYGEIVMPGDFWLRGARVTAPEYILFWNAFILEIRGSQLNALEAEPQVARLADGERSTNIIASAVDPLPDSVPPGRSVSWESILGFNWCDETLQLGELHNRGYFGTGRVISIIDTGIDTGHSAVRNVWQGEARQEGHLNVIGGYWPPFSSLHDTDGHGTFSAGAAWIAARDADFVICKQGTFATLAACLNWSMEIDADVITTSLGYPNYNEDDGTNSLSTAFQEAAASDPFVSILAAAGDCSPGGEEHSPYPADPSTAPLVLSISSSNSADQIHEVGSPCNADSFGKPDFAAPGASIVTIGLGDTIGASSGSSVATPLAAGTVLLLREALDNHASVVAALEQSAQDISGTALDGEGRIDAYLAYQQLLDRDLVSDFDAMPTFGSAPLTVNFTSKAKPADEITEWAWDFDNDGIVDSHLESPSYVYTVPGSYAVGLTVSRNTETSTLIRDGFVSVGTEGSPHPPSLTITEPDGGVSDDLCVVRWQDSDPDDDARISLFYDSNSHGLDGSPILGAGVISEDDPADLYAWQTASVAEGFYWVYGTIDDGTSQSASYSPGPVEIRHAAVGTHFSIYAVVLETEDGDIYAESGEFVETSITLEAGPLVDLVDVEAVLSTDNLAIEFLDEESYYGNVPAGSQAIPTDSFAWRADADFEGPVAFSLLLEYSDADGYRHLQVLDVPAVQVSCVGCVEPSLSVVGGQTAYWDGGSVGNGDGLLQSGEEDVAYELQLHNSGNGAAVHPRAEVLDAAPAGVNLRDRTVDYPDLGPGESSYQAVDDTLTVRVAKWFSGSVSLDLEIRYNETDLQTVPFTLDVAPAAWIDIGPTALDLGAHVLDGPAAQGIFTILNEGSAPLTISGATYDQTDISITSPVPPFDVAPGGTQDVTVTYTSTDVLGFFSREITLQHNSHLEQQTVYDVFGTVVPPATPYNLVPLQTVDNDNAGEMWGDRVGDIEAGDFDGDGEQEIVLLTRSRVFNGHERASVLIYDFDGSTWQQVFNDGAPGWIEEVKNLAVGDLDGDSRPEIAVASSPGQLPEVPTGAVYVYDWNGSYSLGATIRSNAMWKDGITVGDADQDGHGEIVFFEKDAGNPSSQARLFEYEQTSGMSFTLRWQSPDLFDGTATPELVHEVAGLTIADSDLDGQGEILLMADFGRLLVYENHSLIADWGQPQFGEDWDCEEFCDLTVADSDGDGSPEIIFFSEGSDLLYLVENTGNNAWDVGSPALIPNVHRKHRVIVGDLDGDLSQELILAGDRSTGTPILRVFENFADDSYQEVYAAPDFIMNSDLYGVAAADLPSHPYGQELLLGEYDDEFHIWGVAGGLPDLAIQPQSIQFSGALVENAAIDVECTVSDLAGGDVSDVVVAAYDHAPVGGSVPFDQETVQVAAGSGQVTFAWSPTLEGVYDVHLVVDPDGLITESDEGNNTASSQVAIADDDMAGPDVDQILASESAGNGDGEIDETELVLVSCEVTDPSGVSAVECQIDLGTPVPMVLNGQTYEAVVGPLPAGTHDILIAATDGDNSPEIGTGSGQVPVVGVNHPPIVLNPVPTLDMGEDLPDSSIVLSNVFFDEDGDALEYSYTGADRISVSILPSSAVLFQPDPHWFGTETITFTADDQQSTAQPAGPRSGVLEGASGRSGALGRATATTDVVVTVASINDAPVIEGLPGSIVLDAADQGQLDVWIFVEDIESPDSALDYVFDVVPPTVLVNFSPATGVAQLTATDGFGQAQLILTVSDPELASDVDSLLVLELVSSEFADLVIPALSDSAAGRGVAWVDFPSEGDLDLYLGRGGGGANVALGNDGFGNFGVLGIPGLESLHDPFGLAVGDMDNDGSPEIYLANFGAPNELRALDGTDLTAPPLDFSGLSNGATWVDYNGDGLLDLYLCVDGPNHMFRNDGSGFADVSVGLGDGSWSAESRWADYDNDGDPDCYLANVGAPNRLYRNDFVDGVGGFVDVTPTVLANADGGQGIAWGDYDNDEDLDLYLSNWMAPNRLFRNDDGAFVDVTSGPLGNTGHGQSGVWGDYDNDADLDLFLTNQGEANELLRNDGGGAFVSVAGIPSGVVDAGLGAAWGDCDADGDLDLVTTAVAGPGHLYRNDISNGNHWLHIDLEATESNGSAIGARVRVLSNGQWQIREVGSNHGFWSVESALVEFGLGAATVAAEVHVRWPSGSEQMLTSVGADQVLHVVEPPPCDSLTVGPGWTLVGVPRALEGGETDPSQLFPGMVVYEYDTAGGQYVTPASMEPGGGYWVGVADSSHSAPYCSPYLESWSRSQLFGWGLIGPVREPIAFTNLSTVPPGALVPGTLLRWDRMTMGYVVADSLVANQGYWVLAAEDCVIDASSPGGGGGILVPPVLLARSGGEAWSFELEVDAPLYGDRDVIGLGGHPAATDGFDPGLDVPLPPRAPAPGRLDAAWRIDEPRVPRLAVDLRPTSAGAVWTVVVHGEGSRTMEWGEPDGVPGTLELRSMAGDLIAVLDQPGSWTLPEESVWMGQVLLADPATSAPLALPVDFALGRPYPSPSRGAVTIPLALPRDEHVCLRVFDVSGRLVRTITDRSFPGGQHEVTWDGRTTSAQKVAAGIYWILMEAGEHRDQRRIVHLR